MTETPTEPLPRAIEMAPSEVRADEPQFARLLALVGLLPLAVGAVTVILPMTGGKSWISSGFGYLFLFVGLACLLIHAFRDSEVEIRRAYGAAAAALIAITAALCVIPWKAGGAEVATTGALALPWGAGLGLVALLFLLAFVRHETDPTYRSYGLLLMLVFGAMLAGGSVVSGLYARESLVGSGIVLGLIGLAYIAGYLSQEGADDGLGRTAAMLLGLVGAATVLTAFGMTTLPTVMHDGRQAILDTATQKASWTGLLGRAIVVLAFVGIAAVGATRKDWPVWVRGGLGIVGLGFAGVFVWSAFAAIRPTPPVPFLIPYGLILAGLGLAYLAVAIGAASDAQLVVLMRRELAGFFYSPIAYVVLFGMTILQWGGFWLFVRILGREDMQEPILANYYPGTLFGPLAAVFVVPPITMRLFSEEKRSGSMEVLMTAPVSEVYVTLSKFLAAWVFYMLIWLPMGLYLIGLRVEGGKAFDYRPLLGLYVAVAVSGFAFMGMGLFFSSLTQNQIIAAVLTGAGMMFLFCTKFLQYFPLDNPFWQGVSTALSRMSYYDLWERSLGGQLLVRDVLVQLSAAVFWLFLTVKSLQARKWS